jgi:hypothetical protein
MTSGGLPHSGTRGSTPADGSPRLVAAFRALHRPSTPRHPPCARPSSAIALAHDAEPTGSTHVHHSALVKDPEAPTSLARTTRPRTARVPRANPDPDPAQQKTARASGRLIRALLPDATATYSAPSASPARESRCSRAPHSRGARTVYQPRHAPRQGRFAADSPRPRRPTHPFRSAARPVPATLD